MARLPWAAMSLSVSFEPEARKAAQLSSTSLIEPLPVKHGFSSALAADPAAGAAGGAGSAGVITGAFGLLPGAGSSANNGPARPAASTSVAAMIAALDATALRLST